MQGVPGLSEEELLRVSQSAEIHARSRRVIGCIREAAGEAGLEQPPSSMAWLEEDNITLLRELCAHCAHVAACEHGVDFYKSWAFCASFASIRALACTCCHAPGTHKSIAGLKQGNIHVSASTAQYPASLAAALAALLKPFCTQTGIRNASISDFANLLCEPVVHRRPPVCDGAGFNSTADHTNPKASSPFQDLIQHWQQYALQHDLSPHIVQRLAQGIDSHPLTQQQHLDLAEIAHKCLHPSCSQPDCLLVTPGQPFRINLLQAFAARVQDPDTQLTDLMKQGVPAGILDEIPSSVQWTQRQHDLDDDDLEGTHLLHCQGNWTQAERNPALLQQLAEQEVANGWVKPFPAGRNAVAQHWPAGSAIGKLNIVTAEGKEPRLVLDSTVCNANVACRVPEKVSLPSNLDVRRTFSSDDAFGRWVALSLDFKAAHKCIKVQAFSAYWWQRAGGQMLRIVHALLVTFSHRAWLYVDDLLALLCNHSVPQQVTIITFFLACINAPISWKKAQLGNIVTWCGWTLHTDLESSHLAIGKLRKLQEQLEKLACSKKIPRKHLERALGLLMWATSACTHLRPYMAPLYKDMYSGRGALRQIHARDWHRFLDALSPDAVVQRQPLGMWLHTGSQLTEVGSQKIQSKADVPRVVSSAKPQWVRMADPMRNEIHLRNESRTALRWLSSCFSHDQLRLVRQAPQLHCLAAADAMAEGSTVGIGGWISTSQSFAWFSEQWDMTEVRKHWPQLTKNAQAYIACFETLAQLALAMTAVARMRTKHFRFVLPAASDNTSAESGVNRLFTTTEPLSHFLQIVAAWSAHANVRLALTHIAGEKNVWADELSRNRTARFQHREHERERISLSSLSCPKGTVTLHPQQAAWPDELRQAQFPP